MRTHTPLALHQDQRRRTKVHIALMRNYALNSNNFLNMAVCISLSPFRCLLQTMTISLHCCPIMSPFGPLFCESVEKKWFRNTLRLSAEATDTLFYFSFFGSSHQMNRCRLFVLWKSLLPWSYELLGDRDGSCLLLMFLSYCGWLDRKGSTAQLSQISLFSSFRL